MTAIPHRHSISRRSSIQQLQQPQSGVNSNSTRAAIRGRKSKTAPNEVKTTISRLEYLNNKFNVNPSFEIEISGDEADDSDADGTRDAEDGQRGGGANGNPGEHQHSRTDVQFDPQLMDIDIKRKQQNIDQMASSLDLSISLLTPLFQYIQDFESNLNTLSNEMEVLQTRLVNLNNEIQKNSKIDNILTPILNDMLIPPQCIKILLYGKIDEKWVEQLTILQEKRELLQNYQTKEKVNHENIVELLGLIDKLELKCVERIKRFLIENIKHLRGTQTSSVKVQSRLLQVKEIFVFLKGKNGKLAKEFEMAYVYTIRWYYYYNFVKYISSLEGLKILENEYDAEKKGTLANTTSLYGQRSLLLDNTDSINEYLINLPKRMEKMNDENNQYSILGQIAESSGIGGTKFYMEQIFVFLNQTMMDNLTIEFNFIVEFFVLTNNDEINSMVKQIFSPIMRMGTNFMTYLLNSCRSDYFGILLTIRRIQRMEYEIQNRCLPELFESYLNTQLLALWPVFQRDVDALCNSITQTLASTSVIKAVLNSRNNILIPLKITQSFSIVLSNLVQLVQNLVFELETSEPLNSSIERLSNTFERGMVQLGGSLDDAKGKRRLFLYVNFQLVYNVLDNEMSAGVLAGGTRSSVSGSVPGSATPGMGNSKGTGAALGKTGTGETSAVGEAICKHYEQLVQAYT